MAPEVFQVANLQTSPTILNFVSLVVPCNKTVFVGHKRCAAEEHQS